MRMSIIFCIAFFMAPFRAGAEDRLQDVARRSMPVVAALHAGRLSGTGFIVRGDGLLATNYHVVAQVGLNGKVEAQFSNGAAFEGRVTALNREKDIALIQLETARRDWPVLPLGSSLSERAGHPVLVIGNPHDRGLNADDGEVTRLYRWIPQYYPGLLIQISVPIYSGHSGAPLINSDGDIIGMIYRTSMENSNVAVAIPVEYLKSALAQYEHSGRISSSRLGASVDLLNGLRGGIVHRLEPGFSEKDSTLRPGDRILSMDGRPLPDSIEDTDAAIRLHLMDRAPGETLKVQVARGDRLLDIPVTLGEERE